MTTHMSLLQSQLQRLLRVSDSGDGIQPSLALHDKTEHHTSYDYVIYIDLSWLR